MSQTFQEEQSLADRVKSLQLPNNTRVARRKPLGLFKWFMLAALVGSVGYLGWIWKTKQPTPTDIAGTSPALALKPTATEKDPMADLIGLEAGGYLIPSQKVQVSPKVGGQVKQLFIEEGMFFEAGTKLAVLEKDEYQFDYNRTKASEELSKARLDELLAGAREEEKIKSEAAVREAHQSLTQSREELAKIERSGSAIAPDEIDKARSRVRISEERLKQVESDQRLIKEGPRAERILAARAELSQTQSELAKAKWRLDNCEVVAPISGVILEKKTELGNTVRPEAFSNGLSASVCDMADLRKLEVEVDISERDISKVFKGQECVVTVEAFKDKKYKAEVARIMPIASRSKASVTARVKLFISENERDLRPEMRARVQFLKSKEQIEADKKKKEAEEAARKEAEAEAAKKAAATAPAK